MSTSGERIARGDAPRPEHGPGDGRQRDLHAASSSRRRTGSARADLSASPGATRDRTPRLRRDRPTGPDDRAAGSNARGDRRDAPCLWRGRRGPRNGGIGGFAPPHPPPAPPELPPGAQSPRGPSPPPPPSRPPPIPPHP